MLDTPKNSPAMSKEDARADTPQSQKTVKSETASRPSSPPLGLLGASPLGSPGAISKSSQEESAPSPSPSLLNKLPASPANKPPKRSTSTKPSVHEQVRPCTHSSLFSLYSVTSLLLFLYLSGFIGVGLFIMFMFLLLLIWFYVAYVSTVL
jgi:hypothetical protein